MTVQASAPRLPIELLRSIVDIVALDLPETFCELDLRAREARQTLCKLSVTSKTMASIVRPILWSNITLSSVNQLESFLKSTDKPFTLDSSPIVEPSSLVRAIRIGHVTASLHMLMLVRGDLSHQNHRHQLKEVFKRCHNVRELRLAGLKQASSWIVPMSNLESLFILNCSIDASIRAHVAPPLMPHLTRLYITDNFFVAPADIISTLLSPETLPNLRSLAFALNHMDVMQQPASSAWTLTTTTAPVLNQLFSLSTSEELDESLEHTNIEFLDCWHDQLWTDSMRYLPKRLRYLRLNDSAHESQQRGQQDEFTAAWTRYEAGRDTECLTRLERIWVPQEWRALAMFDPLRRQCQAKGVTITYEGRHVDESDPQAVEDAAFDHMFWKIAQRTERERVAMT
ncbi:hypothetical protein OIV83_002754 [Microbotryomycetes sp. JL201]|nr:hypothetical protein OIV83_002754 [Microbotryomycetes sp. JL201]